ncbi:hypothetical protein HL653_11245 [Sphingomonas sp. AP4-R1]|uniref:F0F1 ATP synthase subunit B family protein n=1 Tax=Sphingomonas sp. AP4-R1 TaxID=2735134 RepID=UPI001493777F|nr:hypothetical protein [Sphingomonas sp. AP4-R1]QJU58283.1 hypothetical protein HL653_11245 [Sphingomonas sp. AP4-R1]
MRIDWWTLALQAVNVLILVWLLGRFLFRPVLDTIAARQASAQALLDDAGQAKDRAEAEAQALKEQNEGFLTEAAARRAEIRTEAEAERQRLLAQARLAADAVVAQGHVAIDAERGRVAAQWRERAGSLAASMAGTLLARLPPEQTMQAMVDALKARLGDLSEADRRSLTAAGPVTVATPAPLTPDLQAEVARALGDILLDTTTPIFAVDPDLIAGAELRTPHAVVRNSWRADLDAMVDSLNEDDYARIA